MKESKPKTMMIAPYIPSGEMMVLRAGIDEERCDPDYSVLISYECDWTQFGSNFGILGNFPAFKT